MSRNLSSEVAVIGIDIGKKSFHVVGLDARGTIQLRQKWSRGQVEGRLANMPPCLIGMEACVGAHHLSRKLKALVTISADAGEVRTAIFQGTEERLPRRGGNRRGGATSNDEVCDDKDRRSAPLASAASCPERMVSQRTGIINQIRVFLLERGVAVRQGLLIERPDQFADKIAPCHAVAEAVSLIAAASMTAPTR
jgi:transposase